MWVSAIGMRLVPWIIGGACAVRSPRGKGHEAPALFVSAAVTQVPLATPEVPLRRLTQQVTTTRSDGREQSRILVAQHSVGNGLRKGRHFTTLSGRPGCSTAG